MYLEKLFQKYQWEIDIVCIILGFTLLLCCPQPSVNGERHLAHRQGRRALKASLTLGVLLGLFFSAWLPFFITNMAQVGKGIRHYQRYTATKKHNKEELWLFIIEIHGQMSWKGWTALSRLPSPSCQCAFVITNICNHFPHHLKSLMLFVLFFFLE